MQFNFDATQYQPVWSAGGGLPAGTHDVAITADEWKPTKGNDGFFLALTLTALNGMGSQIARLNIQNNSQEATRIAYNQLAALCLVTGVRGFQDTRQLYNIPFKIVVGPQANNDQYSEIKEILFANGAKIGQGGGAPPNAGALPGPGGQAGPSQAGPGPGAGPGPNPGGFGQPGPGAGPNPGFGQPNPGAGPGANPQQGGWGQQGGPAPNPGPGAGPNPGPGQGAPNPGPGAGGGWQGAPQTGPNTAGAPWGR